MVKTKRNQNMSRPLRLAALGLAVVAAVLVVIYFANRPKIKPSQPNSAQTNLKPVLGSIKDLGGQPICDSGSNGHQATNHVPWYDVVVAMPDHGDLTNQIKSLAAKSGFHLTTDTQLIQQLQAGREQVDGTYDAKNDYLLDDNSDGRSLEVSILRNRVADVGCGAGSSRHVTFGAGDALVDFNLNMPPLK